MAVSGVKGLTSKCISVERMDGLTYSWHILFGGKSLQAAISSLQIDASLK